MGSVHIISILLIICSLFSSTLLSFAAPTMSKTNPDVSNVEMEDVSTFQYQLAGAEVRCRTCGGHLGDVFADGFLFPGTPAFATGKR